MLLIHQPQHPTSPSLMPPFKQVASNYHRRNPSAPATIVQVQPTKIPGLLSLSKPPQQPRTHQQSPNVRHPTPRQPKTKSPQSQQTPQDRERLQRGRENQGKDRPPRNPSKPRAGHGGRARQPSPSPIPFPVQAPKQQLPQDDESAIPRPAPATLPKVGSPNSLVSTPSGKLAKRRKRASIPFPASVTTPVLAPKPKNNQNTHPTSKAKPVPVPTPSKAPKELKESLPISRSDPIFSHFPRGPVVREGVDAFPICDDNDDSELERPSTPSPSRQRQGNAQHVVASSDLRKRDESHGPRTAPLSSQASEAKHYFSSSVSSSPVSPRRSSHKRTPSVPADALYNLSFESDNEFTMSTGDGDVSPLFGRSVRRPRLHSSVRSAGTPNGKRNGAFAYASSTFQNSPSPDQLPPPPSFSFVAMREAAEHLSD